MDIRTTILTIVLVASLILFGIGLFGISFGEETRSPVIGLQKETRVVLAQFPNARILVLFIIGFIIGLLASQIGWKR